MTASPPPRPTDAPHQADPSPGDGPSYDTDRVFTVPNLLSFLRLVGVPVFVWLVLGPHADAWAVLLLMVSGFTDWLDGHLARSWHQTSRIGQMLDPVADRLYIAATIICLAVRDIIPWWLVAALILRDAVLLGCVPLLRTRGYTSLPVHFIGKCATFCLLYAFPLVLLGAGGFHGASWCRVAGWAFAIWGTGLYWWAGLLYVRQTFHLLQTPRAPRDVVRRPAE